jgi:hypothetical protein
MNRTTVDRRLMRALQEGCDALPEDLDALHGYLMLISELLSEKGDEFEPCWSLALAGAAQLQTLQDLEALVARKAAQVRAGCLAQVLRKLAIWEALEPGGEEEEEIALRDSLVHSVRLDLQLLTACDQAPCA